MNKDTIWIVGTGPIGIEYGKILNALGREYIAIGRGKENCDNFYSKTNAVAIDGGIEKFLATNPVIPKEVIVAVNIQSLKDTAVLLLNYGVKKILLEKPGVCYPSEISVIANLCREKNATVVLAYNRRFYASVRKAKEIIEEDGGVQSCFFDFTELTSRILNIPRPESELNSWFLANSSHPIDTAFYLIGEPKEICCFHTGGLSWHPASSVFSGAGVSTDGVLFSYHANWESAGRWSLEIMTKKHKLIFKPLEKLQIQVFGSLETSFVEIDDKIDQEFKPGFYLQTKAFLENELGEFCNVYQQEKMMGVYKKMSGYAN